MPVLFKISTRQLKRIVLLIPFIAHYSFVLCQQADKSIFQVKGRIKNFGTGILIGTIKNSGNNTIRLDTINIKNDSFNHTACIEDPQIVNYQAVNERFARYHKVVKNGDSVLVDFADAQLKCLEIVAAPGWQITVTGAGEKYLAAYPSGTAENVQLATFNQKLYPLLDQLSDLDYTDRKRLGAVLKAEDVLNTAIADLRSDFIKKNPSSIISSYLVWKQFMLLNKKHLDKADSVFQLIHPVEKDIYQQQILLVQQSRTTLNELLIGQLFPDFKTKFVYKSPDFHLSQTRGKYTLIDFWGSWCIPCVKELPRLKTYYDKFSSKLNIVSIASDDYVRWRAFLDKNHYNWVQILDQETPRLSDRFSVQVYPTKYLLGPDGTLLMIFKDATDEVWQQLDHLLISSKEEKQ